MAQAIEDCVPLVAASKVGRWVKETAAERIATRTERISAMESNSAIRAPRLPQPSGPRFDMTAHPSSGSMMVGSPASVPTTVQGGVAARTPPPAPVPAAAPPRRSGVRVALAVLAALLALAAVVAGAVLLWHRKTVAAVVAAPVPSAVPVPAVETAAPAVIDSAPAPSASQVASAEPTAPSARPVPIPVVPLTALPTAASAAPRVVPKGRPATGAATTAKPALDCNPPYYFNAKGDRIFKQECL
jgi:hypothetical protein